MEPGKLEDFFPKFWVHKKPKNVALNRHLKIHVFVFTFDFFV
jgi:hypothetical protein